MTTAQDIERQKRDAEAHLAEMREKLLRELNWRSQEERWRQEARHDRRQLWFWFGVVVIAALGIIFR